MAGHAQDRLSALGDDLLMRILHFVPVKEAASTSVLSRRWGSLWRSSGGVNLAVRCGHEGEDFEAICSRHKAFVPVAMAALDAASATVTRLTFRLEAAGDDLAAMFLYPDGHRDGGIMTALASHQAARRVEEFRVAVVIGSEDDFPFASFAADVPYQVIGNYHIDMASLPSETLRVLDLARCGDLSPPPAAEACCCFPRLENLRLRRCSVVTSHLQALIDAAPTLATVHLESVFFEGTTDGGGGPAVRLRCPTVTELVLELCGMVGQVRGGYSGSVEIDAPRLRHFRYKGRDRRFSLSSPAPDMASVNLHFLADPYQEDSSQCDDKDSTRVLFWDFVRNFTGARVLKLKVNRLKDIAVRKRSHLDLLCTFHRAVHLELAGAHCPSGKAAAVAIANLLRCCPVLRDLRLNFSTVPSNSFKNARYRKALLEMRDRLDYEKSVDRFTRRPSRLLNSMSMDNINYACDEVPDDIPGLSGRSFTCLQTHLRRVDLKFTLDNSGCFGVQLLKFFVGNAKALKEIYVDMGNRKLCEFMNLDVESWITPTSSNACLKRKNVAESSWEFSMIPREPSNSKTDLSFTVLPLQR